MRFRFSVLVLLFPFLTSFAAAKEIRFVSPPNLSSAFLGERIVCTRPRRKGAPLMNVVMMNGQVVVNAFGHGGSGWTLGPGTAKYVVGLLEAGGSVSRNTPIAVLGAGAIGLFIATELVSRGFTDITIVAESFDNLTSHRAGGLLAPVSMDNGCEEQALIDSIGIDAYLFYQQIALGQHPFIQSGARLMPTYFPDRKDSGLEPYVGKVMAPAKDVVLDFGTGMTRPMVSYDDGIFMDTGGLMQQLTAYLKSSQIADRVKFEQRKIGALTEVAQRVVFNSTGLGARDLVANHELTPVQGHLIMLKDQSPTELEHMILAYGDPIQTLLGHTGKLSFYMFPKKVPNASTRNVGVIGGTFIEDVEPDVLNLELFGKVITNARSFYGLPCADSVETF